MSAHHPFDPAGAEAIRRALCAGEAPLCPACGVELGRTPVPPRPDVSYVRERVWLLCPSCRGSIVVDRVGGAERRP